MLQVFATHTSTSWFWFRGCRYEVLPAQTFFQDFVQRNVKWSVASFPDVYCVDWTHLGLPLTFSSSCGFFQAFACSSLPGERKRTSYETERMRWVCQWMSPVCVCVHCYSHAENYNWTFDDYARYVFRIHAPKTMHVMFSEFMRQRLLNSRGLQGMS